MNWQGLLADRMAGIGHSDVASILKLAERPDVISFAGGLPDPESYLLDEVRAMFERMVANSGRAALNYGPTAGTGAMREWLADHMSKMGRPTVPDECLLTTGGIAALDLICKSMLNPGDVVVVAEPAYLAALHVFRSYEAQFAGVPLDESGMSVEGLESTLARLRARGSKPKLIYTVPSFQNPAGVTMPAARREALVRIAASHGIPIVADEAYRDLRFENEAPPLMAAFDPTVVLHINTFSKTFCPGIRLGWIAAPKDIVDTLILAKQGQDQCASTLGQHLVLAFAEAGLLHRQIDAAIAIYKRKRDITMAAMAAHLPQGTSWTRPEGGFYTWVSVPGSTDTTASLQHAIESQSVAFVSGTGFYHDRRPSNSLRLCYSYVPENQIADGIRRLGAVFGD